MNILLLKLRFVSISILIVEDNVDMVFGYRCFICCWICFIKIL